MRHLILASIVIFVVGITSISSLMGSDQTNQLDTNLLAYQEEAPPAPEPDELATAAAPSEAAAPAIQETQESVSDIPIVDTPVPEGESVLQEPMQIQLGEVPAEYIASDVGYACNTCGCQTCCCPPCPVSTTFVITDPCKCCSYEVCVTVPPCCVGNAPTVNWRGGVLGRRVAEMCWPCCDKHVKVIVTRHGKVKVRG